MLEIKKSSIKKEWLKYFEPTNKFDCIERCPCRILDKQSGNRSFGNKKGGYSYKEKQYQVKGFIKNISPQAPSNFGDIGGASRFFYQAKTSNKEKWFYCKICNDVFHSDEKDNHIHDAKEKEKYKYQIWHPTQKPESLMTYLVRLITPPNEVCLDPFAGTGTTCVSCEKLGIKWIGIDKDKIYCKIIQRRLDEFNKQLRLL